MSDGVHLLVPFATCSAAECGQALQGLALPNLLRLVRRLGVEGTDLGEPASLSPPHERELARAYGLQPVDGLIPLAALQVLEDGAGDAAAPWAWIHPAHWRVGSDHIAMAHPQDLQLDAEDSHALLEAMRPWFAEDGIALSYDAPLRWLAQGELFRSLPTASLDRVVGRNIQRWLPAGAQGAPVRRLQQEMQMLLYTLPLNDERQRGGLLPVNSFWASGTGALPPATRRGPIPGLQISPYLRDAALVGDWRAWAAAWQELDARDCARLLTELDAGRSIRLTLCGEAGARTWSSAAAAGGWRRLANLFSAPTAADLLEGL
ncbi:phosphoglycerate mutase [Ramlibacter ginsenosidimutans]|uniref:Phosphoglycerate mutase n=1 Tax=Ramlibacter ginsenosidimutans TaxID=502333 RepID=A0A934WNK1_9BURK|nr:phosphoglycerate mutase [Ramlibacter ginsenosidimutans]